MVAHICTSAHDPKDISISAWLIKKKKKSSLTQERVEMKRSNVETKKNGGKTFAHKNISMTNKNVVQNKFHKSPSYQKRGTSRGNALKYGPPI